MAGFDVSGFFVDADASDLLTYSATGLPAGLTIDATTGVISGTIDSSASAGSPYAVEVTATDPHGASVTQSFAWSVSNPAPLADDDSFSANEDDGPTLVGNALGNDSDPDNDALSATVQTDIAGTNGGLFSIAADGGVSFEANGEFEDLALGETRQTSFVYTLVDADGATDTATVTVTVTGQNDAPVAVGTIADRSNNDSDAVSLDVSGFFADADASDLLTYSATDLPLGLSINPNTGIIGGTLDSSACLFGPYAVEVTATDPQGVSVSQAFVWHVANPAPAAGDDEYDVGEDDAAAVLGNVLDNDGDPDGDVLGTVPQSNVAGSEGGRFSIDADGNLSFDPAGDFENLALGQSRVTSFTYSILDGNGGTDTATVTVTVAGVNDTPHPVGTIADRHDDDSTSINLDAGGFFADVDTSDVLTYSATGLPPGLSIDSATGVISGTLDSSASAGGPYAVEIVATDPHGAAVAQAFVWNVANPAPAAANDSYSTNQKAAAAVIGNALANDSDPDGDDLAAIPRQGVAGSNGGLFSIAANGDVSFDPAGAFDDLLGGQARQTSFTYSLVDADGATRSATVTVTVVGVNSPPKADSGFMRVSAGSNNGKLGLKAPSDPDGNRLTIRVTSLPRVGTLHHPNGKPVLVGQVLSSAQLERLVYDAPAHYSGKKPVYFRYLVNDGQFSTRARVAIHISRPASPCGNIAFCNLIGKQKGGTSKCGLGPTLKFKSAPEKSSAQMERILSRS